LVSMVTQVTDTSVFVFIPDFKVVYKMFTAAFVFLYVDICVCFAIYL